MDIPQIVHQTRSYQQEMFERSMKGNTIVVMDTGSGKTLVAILRIQAELERCPPEKRIWFLAPAVELCIQQHKVLSLASPAYGHLLLTGSDNVDRWSEQSIWNKALDQQRVVVSTHAVLADALRHGFVNIGDLALLVFDEAHHCSKRHPANVIMQDFYHPSKVAGLSVPHVLGLSASLVIRSNLKSMGEIEANLDSISVTPRIHREDLLRHVHRPECRLLEFDPSGDAALSSGRDLLEQLTFVHARLKSQIATQSSRGLAEDLLQPSTKPLQAAELSIRTFCRKAEHIKETLGIWATQYFITQTLQVLNRAGDEFRNLINAEDASRKALRGLLDHLECQHGDVDDDEPGDHNVSAKVRCLIAFLLDSGTDHPRAIVFVEQRATTSVLAELLRRHPATRHVFRCASFVGASNNVQRRYNLTELVDLKAQKHTVDNFREGVHNLIVATNALEEGIDVQACNIVACFDPPANVKSFIQRRGRARHIRSTLGLLVSSTGDRSLVNKWQSLEEELSRICRSDRERMIQVAAIENQNERVPGELHSPSTGARIKADVVMGHLYHYCTQLGLPSHVDCRPSFSYETDAMSRLISSTVRLPNCLKRQFQEFTSLSAWKTERAARTDAAFQAYSGLFEGGLLNEHLLPLRPVSDMDSCGPLDQPRVTQMAPQIDVWSDLASKAKSLVWHEMVLTVAPPAHMRRAGEVDIKLSLTAPGAFCPVPPLALQWASGTTFTVTFDQSVEVPKLDSNVIETLRATTLLIHSAVRSEKYQVSKNDFITLFAPLTVATTQQTRNEEMRRWLEVNSKTTTSHSSSGNSCPPRSLIRSPLPDKPVFIFRQRAESGGVEYVDCEKLPKTRNFCSAIATPIGPDLAPMSTPAELDDVPTGPEDESTPGELLGPRYKRFRSSACISHSLPLPMARIGLFLPNIAEHISHFIVVERLQSEVLGRELIRNPKAVLTAISAPSSGLRPNYQCLELIGDSALKFVVSAHLFATNPTWHAGLLTVTTSSFVSNVNLAKAADRRRLAPYIITERVQHKLWTPPAFSSESPPPRSFSSKVLADVVEALIGAAWIDSGIQAARKCINLFLPEISPAPVDFSGIEKSDVTPPSNIAEIESLIGYQFRDKSLLLEALTHPSCGLVSDTDSYQRLEFLGDAVLDIMVVDRLVPRISSYTEGQMTEVKHRVTRNDFLAFLCLDLHQTIDHTAVQSDSPNQAIRIVTKQRTVNLVSFVRLRASVQFKGADVGSEERFAQQAAAIRSSLQTGRVYPLKELLEFAPSKFYSDIVESVLGAIFVDSNGSFASCTVFLEKLGLLCYLQRILDGHVDVTHPRDRIKARLRGVRIEYHFERRGEGWHCTVTFDGTALVQYDQVQSFFDPEEALLRVALHVERMLDSGDLTVRKTDE